MAVVGNGKSASSNRKTGLTKSVSSAKGGGVLKPITRTASPAKKATSSGPTTSPTMKRTPGPSPKAPSPLKSAVLNGAKPRQKTGGQMGINPPAAKGPNTKLRGINGGPQLGINPPRPMKSSSAAQPKKYR